MRLLLFLMLSACKGPSTDAVDTDTDTDADADTDADTDADADSDADTDADTDSDTDVDTGLQCVDDAAEPNDDLTQALLSTGETGRVVCDGEPDYWAIAVPAGMVLEADVAFADDFGDIDVRLLDANGDQLDISAGVSDNEVVDWFNDTGADVTVYLWVYMWDGVVNTYGFTTNLYPCVDDGFEDNDDLATSTPWTAGSTTLLRDDDDWFAFTVPPANELTVTLDYVPSEGNIELELLDASGASIDTSIGTNGTEVLTWYNTGSMDETVHARVYYRQFTSAWCSDYVLDGTSALLVCNEDGFEDNDDQAAAVAAPTGTLGVSETDPDWWFTTVPAGQAVEVFLQYDETRADLEVDLFDAAGTSIFSFGNPVSWANNGTAPEDLYIQVTATDGVCADYDLLITDITPVCVDDAHEPDDDAANSGPGVAGAYTMFDADPDFFRFDVAPGHELRVTADYLEIYGEMDLVLYDLAGTEVQADRFGVLDIDTLNETGATVSYDLAVEPVQIDAACVPYDLIVTDVDCDVLDIHEPNDDLASAAMVSAASGLTVRVDDDDWFAVGTVAPNQTIEVALDFVDALGNVDAELLDGLSIQLDESTSQTDGELLTWTNDQGVDTEVFVRVYTFGFTSCINTYELTTTL